MNDDLQLRRVKRMAIHALQRGIAGSSRVTGTAIRDARTVPELLDLFPLTHKADLSERSEILIRSPHSGDELILRTSGSSGGVIEVPWRREDLVASRRSCARTVARARCAVGLEPTPGRSLLAMGGSPFHASVAIYNSVTPTTGPATLRVGVEKDLGTVVARVVAASPDHLTTYPSVASLLVRHPWKSFPASVVLGGEHASTALQEGIEGRGALVVNTYGCTEIGMIAVGVGSSGPLEILWDDVVVERLRSSGSRPGYERIALTSLHNTCFPIFRYVVDDEVRVESCAGTLVTALSDVLPGVEPEVVTIAGFEVSSRSLRGVLDSVLRRGCYRLSVHARGLDITLDRDGRRVADQVRGSVMAFLTALGVTDPQVVLRVVDVLASGKEVRRIVVEDTR